MAEVYFDITKRVKEIAEKALDEYEYQGETIRSWIKKILSGEYQPAKYGKWVYGCTKTRKCYHYYCSECGQEAYWDTYNGPQLFNYCPSCGAEMRGEKN